jgi:hypothetical protein
LISAERYDKSFKLAEMLLKAWGKKRSKDKADEIMKFVEEEIAPDPYTIYRLGRKGAGIKYVTDELKKALRMSGIGPHGYGSDKAKKAKKGKKKQH